MRRLGILTSGGDAPGMNTTVRAIVRVAAANNIDTIGIEHGFQGVCDAKFVPLSTHAVADILHKGGTELRTARCDAMFTEEGQDQAVAQLRRKGIDSLIVIGGDGSLHGAHVLATRGIQTVGIPASIDNDISGTDMSIGVDSALNTIMEVMDKLRDTAASHKRVFLIETMGRNCGYLALMAGVIGGAVFVVMPEIATNLDEIGTVIASASERGTDHALVVVAEGAQLNAQSIGDYLDNLGVGFESRITTLGHIQRGGYPSAFDRMLASRMGIAALDAIEDGESDVFTALRGPKIELAPLTQIVEASAPTTDYQRIAQVLAPILHVV